MKKYVNIVLVTCLIFLPLSAWLVSLTGDYRLSLGRDLLLLLLIPFAILQSKRFPQSGFVFVLGLFLSYLLLSFFWRDESLAQWLRGVRFYGGPLLLGALAYFLSRLIDQKKLWRIVAWSTLGVALLGFFEYFFPEVIRYSFVSEAARGQLDNYHLAGEYARMQGTLSGPNALGLFFVVALLTFPIFSGAYKLLKPAVYVLMLVGLVLTFSRSSLIGYLVAMMIAGAVVNPIWRRPRLAFLAVALAVTLGVGVYSWLSGDTSRQYSNETRLEQYERVIEDWDKIGVLGKGPGSAGLVSQYRFDGKENNYTENIYLDIFEGLGVIGLALYLSVWITALTQLFGSRKDDGFWLGISGIGLMVAGIFISHYTGQAAIFYFWLLAGLSLGTLQKDEHRA